MPVPYFPTLFLTVNHTHIHSLIKNYEYWTTVPCHKKKLKQRNLDIVRSLFENTMKKNNIQYLSLFERSKHTKPLYNLTVEQRKKTIQGCFNVITKNVSIVKNKKLLIVDDIITTGTTINEIKKSLSGHINDENVQYIKFARSVNSHDINFNIPEGIKISVEKQTTLKIAGHDKQQVGEVSSKLKTFRKIEPYKGKWVREKGQYILKKEGKKK